MAEDKQIAGGYHIDLKLDFVEEEGKSDIVFGYTDLTQAAGQAVAAESSADLVLVGHSQVVENNFDRQMYSAQQERHQSW